MNDPGSRVSERWVGWRRTVDLDEYDARWEAMRSRGLASHGEADAVERLSIEHGTVRRVLDAGCGTGRVAIELSERGFDVVGADLDPDMVDRARRKSSAVEWLVVDLASHRWTSEFGVVVLAGNVFNFCAPGTGPTIVERMASAVAPGGVLVAGWTQETGAGAYLAEQMIGDAPDLEHVVTWSTWEGDDFEAGSNYAVVVLRRP